MQRRLLHLALVSLVVAVPCSAQESPWTWRGRLDPGEMVQIKGLFGAISAVPVDGDEVEVRAVKTGSAGDTADVRMEVMEYDGGVIICAIYEAHDRCDPQHQGQMVLNPAAPVSNSRCGCRVGYDSPAETCTVTWSRRICLPRSGQSA